MNCAGPVLLESLESLIFFFFFFLESLIFIKESPKSKLTRESLDFSMLAIQIWTMELIGAQNNFHPQAIWNTDWPLGDHNVTRAAWSPVCKGCWLVLGSVKRKSTAPWKCISVQEQRITMPGLLLQRLGTHGRAQRSGVPYQGGPESSDQLGSAVCPQALSLHSSRSTYC